MEQISQHVDGPHNLSKEDLEKIRFDLDEEYAKRIIYSGEFSDLPPIEETEAYKKFVAAGLLR